VAEAGGNGQPDKSLWLEATLLQEIAMFHPDRLTTDELVLLMENQRRRRDDILDALTSLQRSGLLRRTGEVIEPTHVALRAYELLTL
jgi:hypothetical protein